MRRAFVGCFVAVVLTMVGAAARAEAPGTAIDLTTFGKAPQEPAAVWDELPLRQVARWDGESSRRFYLSGMIGPSFATVGNPGDPTFASDDTLFNAGGALGVAFERRRGQLRLELEGMGRDTYFAPFTATADTGDFTILTNNWSVMTNLWRDLMLTDRFGIYGGGGIGAGGYILGEQIDGIIDYAPPAGAFAWQFGGGLIWEVTDRLTFDVGYRYFHINTIRQANVEPNQFAASELMFALRLYEPFRGLRR
jgi:opacity protein-like surface antigen